MIPILHHIEDLQVACFALIFGLMIWQDSADRIVRYLCLSYSLATVVSVLDVSLAQPFPPVLINGILAIIAIRYALLAAAIGAFTRRSRPLARATFAIAAITCLGLPLLHLPIPPNRVTAGYYTLLGLQMALLALMVLRSNERSTQLQRRLLAIVFFVSVAFRATQTWIALIPQTHTTLLWRDEAFFINTTVVGCLLPFSLVWLMNARTQNYLLEQSLIDPLTNLLNRRGLADAASRELARYVRARQDFALAIADIDHFKQLNDTHGHDLGDDVLQSAAALIRGTLRQSDIIARTGGEEFVFLLPVTSYDESLAVMERVRSAIQGSSFTSELTPDAIRTTISIGLTHSEGRPNLTMDSLHREADLALYAAKNAGRNRTIPFTPTLTPGP